MGLWAGWNTSIESGESEAIEIARRAANAPLRKAILRGQEQKRIRNKQQIITDIKKGWRKQKVDAEKEFIREGLKSTRRQIIKSGGQIKGVAQGALLEASRAAGIASQQQVTFSQEQRALQQMFGGGSRIWALGDESETRVRIHNDLHPSLNGDRGTANIFFSGGGERSGLF